MSFVRLKPFDKSKGHLKKRHKICKWKDVPPFEHGDWHDVSDEAGEYLATIRSHGGRDAPLAFDVVDSRAAARRVIGAEKLAAMGRTTQHGKRDSPTVPDSSGHSVADDLNLDPTHDIELSDSPVDALTTPKKPAPKKPAAKPKAKAKKKTGRRTRR